MIPARRWKAAMETDRRGEEAMKPEKIYWYMGGYKGYAGLISSPSKRNPKSGERRYGYYNPA